MYNRYLPYKVKNKMMSIRCREIEDNNELEVGYLNVRMFRYILRTPIQNALVRVSKLTITGLYKESGLGEYLDTRISDENGVVPTFTLPVIKNEDEHYIVSVNADGYYIAYIIDVPIYPNVTVSYDIYLRHFDYVGAPNYEFIMQPQIPGRESIPGIIN